MKYKTAIVHEWLVNFAGSESVLEEIYKLYPSPIYTLIADKHAVGNSGISEAEIFTSFIQRLPFAKKKYRSYLPLYPMAIENFDITDYDIILSSSHAVAKGVLKRSDQLHICYCYTPMRYIWDIYHQYLRDSNLTKGLKSMIAKSFLHYLRLWDIASTNRVDYFIADSYYVANRIKSIYRRDAEVIYPPVDIDSFELTEKKDDFYLTASRLVSYKKIDLIVEAFSRMKDKKLVVIGDGPQYNKIKRIATKNIEIIGHQPLYKLKGYMQNARAFIFAALEDFGIMPVEAQASGTPVIAYARGGACETVINNETGLFFNDQSAEAIIEAVNEFERIEHELDSKKIRGNALRFNRESFVKNYKNFVDKAIDEFYHSNLDNLSHHRFIEK
ncbi:MAG: glycosyltransferase family 4 protein [Spirochaetota bacterium]|nr:glycosyltransferase family 4 protein [Spirochaetota bacterium]